MGLSRRQFTKEFKLAAVRRSTCFLWPCYDDSQGISCGASARLGCGNHLGYLDGRTNVPRDDGRASLEH